MKKAILLPVLWTSFTLVFTLPLAAETPGAWVGYVTYAPKPVVTPVGVQDADLKWLTEIASLVGPDGFTFLGRRNADHWMALTNLGKAWMLQIHDETSQYNFRGSVQPKTGVVTVERGVDWAGTSRDADATRAAILAVTYLQRARSSADLFTTGADHSTMDHAAPVVDTHAAPAATHAVPATTHAAPAVHGDGGAAHWQKLVDGNLRFISGRVTRPNQSLARVEETGKGQKPFAIIVTCSDSRLPPEILFDQGIGDLFVIRTAGEVVTEVELGSIEYAVEHLGASYLVVLGHERCGAVDATVKGGDLPPNIEAIAAQIRPAVEAARFFKGDLLDNAVRENAKQVLAKISQTPILSEAMAAGHLNFKAAYYDLDTGRVAGLP